MEEDFSVVHKINFSNEPLNDIADGRDVLNESFGIPFTQSSHDSNTTIESISSYNEPNSLIIKRYSKELGPVHDNSAAIKDIVDKEDIIDGGDHNNNSDYGSEESELISASTTSFLNDFKIIDKQIDNIEEETKKLEQLLTDHQIQAVKVKLQYIYMWLVKLSLNNHESVKFEHKIKWLSKAIFENVYVPKLKALPDTDPKNYYNTKKYITHDCRRYEYSKSRYNANQIFNSVIFTIICFE